MSQDMLAFSELTPFGRMTCYHRLFDKLTWHLTVATPDVQPVWWPRIDQAPDFFMFSSKMFTFQYLALKAGRARARIVSHILTSIEF